MVIFVVVALQPFSYCMENSSMDTQPTHFFVFNRELVLKNMNVDKSFIFLKTIAF